MVRPRRAAIVGCLVFLVGAAGCLAETQLSSDPSPSSPTPLRSPADTPERTSDSPAYREAAVTPEPLAGRANCSDDLWVSFWGLNDARLWKPNQVRYGAYLPPNTSYLFVAYVDGIALGVRSESTAADRGGLNVDGASIEIAEDLAGEHAVRIVVHRDVDHDGEFDPETDPSCYTGEGLVETEYLVIDVDRYW